MAHGHSEFSGESHFARIDDVNEISRSVNHPVNRAVACTAEIMRMCNRCVTLKQLEITVGVAGMARSQHVDELSALAARVAKQEKLLHALRCAYFFGDEAECVRLMDVLDNSFDGCRSPSAGSPKATDGVESMVGRQRSHLRNRTVLVAGTGPDAAPAPPSRLRSFGHGPSSRGPVTAGEPCQSDSESHSPS